MLIRTLRMFLMPYRGLLSFVLILSLAGTMASLYLPTLNASLIDRGLAKGNIGFIWRTGAWMLAVSALQGLCAVTSVYFGAKAAMSFGRDLRGAIFGRVPAFSGIELNRFGAPSLDRFVHSLPKGYDTVIDEEASNISAGEKQLLTIARAFLANPALLILDEATSSVDTRTEDLVQRAMNKLRSDRTSFVIAHRLSTIRDADVILVMENGAIVEHGSHAHLLSLRGRYCALYNSQFQGAIEEPGAIAPVGGRNRMEPVSPVRA